MEIEQRQGSPFQWPTQLARTRTSMCWVLLKLENN